MKICIVVPDHSREKGQWALFSPSLPPKADKALVKRGTKDLQMSEYWFLPFQDYREKMKKTSAPTNSVKFETDAISAARTPRLLSQYLMEAILLFERNEQGPENAKMHGDEITACNPGERICCSQTWWTELHFQWKQFATRRAGPALLRYLPPSSSGPTLVPCPLSATHRCSWEKEQKGGWKTSLWQVIRNQSGSQNSLHLGPLPESQSSVLPQAFLCTTHVNSSCFCTTNAPFHCSASPLLSSTSTSSLQSFKLCWTEQRHDHSVTWHCCTPSRTLVQGSQVRLQSSGLTSTCPTTAVKQLSLSHCLLPLHRHIFFFSPPHFLELTL